MQKARRQPVDSPKRADIGLRLLVSDRFQELFHSPPGVLFSVRSRYWFTIGLSGVFSLGAWAPQIHTHFHEARATQDTTRPFHLRIPGYHRLWPAVPGCSARIHGPKCGPTTPDSKPSGLGSDAFARRY